MYDKEIRESLFFFLEESYGKSRILEEKVIGRARADCVLIQEDSFMGIEIKSDHDSYSRLEGQVKNYNQYFDYNMVVVGSKHAHSIESHVPSFWGIERIAEEELQKDFSHLLLERDYTVFSVEGNGTEEVGTEELKKGKKIRKKKYKRRKKSLTKTKLGVTHLIRKGSKRTVKK